MHAAKWRVFGHPCGFAYVASLIVGLFLFSPPGDAAVLSVDSLTTSPGQDFTLAVRIEESVDLYALQFDLSFNPATLSLMEVSEGEFLRGAGTTVFVSGEIDDDNGMVSLISVSLIGPLPGASGAGVIAMLRFRSDGAGDSVVSLDNGVLLDSNFADISFTTEPGLVNSRPSEIYEPPTVILILVLLVPAMIAIARRRQLRDVTRV